MVGATCHAAFAASDEVSTGLSTETVATPPAQPPAAKAQDFCKKCCVDPSEPNPAAFAKVLLCIAKHLCEKEIWYQRPCDCPPGMLTKRDRDALLEHIKDTLAKLGSLEDATKRNCVQQELLEALCVKRKSNVAREVLALVASMPAKPPKKVIVITETDKDGKGCCLRGKCKITETSEVSAEPVAPAPLSTAVVAKIVCKLKCQPCCPQDCDLPAPCPPPADPCQSASCFDVRWELLNMLIMDAEHQPTRNEAEMACEIEQIKKSVQELKLCEAAKLIEAAGKLHEAAGKLHEAAGKLHEAAAKLKISCQKDLAEQLTGIADDITRLNNTSSTAQALTAELCDYEKLVKSRCGVRILLRVIDGVGDVNEPFKPGFEMQWRLGGT
jgi:hypothetical protein